MKASSFGTSTTGAASSTIGATSATGIVSQGADRVITLGVI